MGGLRNAGTLVLFIIGKNVGLFDLFDWFVTVERF